MDKPTPPAPFTYVQHIAPVTRAATEVPLVFLAEAIAHGEAMAAWGAAQEREKWASCFNEARDAILHDRGPLDGAGMDSDKTNAVLGILDDAFQNLI